MTFYSLQFLRFVAALLVLLFHLFIVSSGYKGVDIFFVISGFVMYYTLFAKKRPDAIHFAVNRVTKIFFLYWVALFWLYFIEPQKFEHLSIKSILLIPSHKSLIGVSWSLSFELYFYFLIGSITYFVTDKFHKTIFIILLFVTTSIGLIDLFTDKLQRTIINYVLGPNFGEFLFGILCAYCSINFHKKFTYSFSITMAICSLLLFLVISITFMNPITFVWYGSLSALTIFFFTVSEQIKMIPEKMGHFFKIIGDASYGIYLFGPIITLMINPLTLPQKLLVIFSTITVSTLFNVFIENRFLLYVRKSLYARFPKK